MGEVLTGGCLCGHVRYRYEGEAGPAGYCHCEDCRRVTGGPFGVSVRLETERFAMIGGNVRSYTKRADSGNELTRHFCPECGSPIYTSSPRHAAAIFVKAGTLDDPTKVRPGHQAWTRSAVAWACTSPDLPAFAEGRIAE